MDLRSTQLKDTYGNLVTTGTTAGSPTTGGLQNGDGELITSVGIGTNSPSKELSIQGNAPTIEFIDAQDLNDVAQFTTTAGNISIDADVNNDKGSSYITFTVDGTSNEKMRIADTGDISFRDGSDSEAFYWDASAGSLGIGTDSPSATLDVKSSGGNTDEISLIHSGNIVKIASLGQINSHGSLVLRQNNGTLQTKLSAIDDSYILTGNFGIGTTSPDAPLTVISNAHIYSEVTDSYLRLSVGNTLASPTQSFVLRIDNSDSDKFQIRDTTNEESRLTIDTSGNVGIGVSDITKDLEVSSANNPTISIANSDTSLVADQTIGILDFASNNEGSLSNAYHSFASISAITETTVTGTSGVDGALIFSTSLNDTQTERMRIDKSGYLRLAGAGIQFNGDTASANALDDYEEGTWTPVYVPSTGSFATMTMNNLTAKYTKIGNMVTVYAVIRTSDVDVTGGSGDVRIDGLPFTVSAFGGGVSLGLTSNFTNAPDGGHFFNATTQITLKKTNVSTGLVVADLSNGTNANHNGLYFTGTYLI